MSKSMICEMSLIRQKKKTKQKTATAATTTTTTKNIFNNCQLIFNFFQFFLFIEKLEKKKGTQY